MSEWNLEKRHLPLMFTWKISRNSSDYKENFFVRFTHGSHEGLGEVAPNIRYGETPDRIEDDFLHFQSEMRTRQFSTLIEVHNFLKKSSYCHSLKFGIESAFTHFLCAVQGKSIHEFFNLAKPEKVYTSFSVPIMEIAELKNFLGPLIGYKSLKIKVNKETAVETINEIRKHTFQPLRIDGNEAFENVDDVIKFLETLDGPIEFIEQPMPAKLISDYKELFKRSKYSLIADESVEDVADFDELSTMFHGINVKLMKTGSYLTAINLLKEARRKKMQTMIGCMIETSLGIKSAYELASLADYLDLDGFLLLKQDPFKLLTAANGLINYT